MFCRKMKCIWIILIFPLIPWVMAKGEMNQKKFEECNSNQWVFINTTIKWDNDTKNITTNITYNKPSDKDEIYCVHIVISDCTNHSVCTGKPVVWIQTINCTANNLSVNSEDACKVAQEAAKLEEEIQWFTNELNSLFGNTSYDSILCMHTADTNLVVDNSEMQSDTETESDSN